jgi:N-methylhydantoinase A
VPPVPRALRVGVTTAGAARRHRRHGAARARDRPHRRAVRRLRAEAIAIGLLHAPADDPTDERALAAPSRALPGVPITCSAELLPASGEYERFSAAILNAAIAPIVGRYTRSSRRAPSARASCG